MCCNSLLVVQNSPFSLSLSLSLSFSLNFVATWRPVRDSRPCSDGRRGLSDPVEALERASRPSVDHVDDRGSSPIRWRARPSIKCEHYVKSCTNRALSMLRCGEPLGWSRSFLLEARRFPELRSDSTQILGRLDRLRGHHSPYCLMAHEQLLETDLVS